MSPEAQAIKDIFLQVKPELMWTFVQLSAFAVAFILAKKGYEALAAYILFIWNKDVGKNVKIVINEREAMITHYTVRFIYIRFQDNGHELIRPMPKWADYEWELVKNGK